MTGVKERDEAGPVTSGKILFRISRRRNRVRSALFVVGIFLSTVGCAREQPAATPARITAADLKEFSWIEGTWRGTGDGIPVGSFTHQGGRTSARLRPNSATVNIAR